MLFNSLAFFIFFPIVFIVYWFLIKDKFKTQNIFLLLSSYVFYGWWDYRFLALILISSTADFVIGNQIYSAINKKKKNVLLIASIAINLGILGFFKYYDFFITSLIDVGNTLGISLHLSTLRFILPVGISFYTFQTMSYTIDIYREKLTPVKDWVAFFTFVAFFPQLVAGPIERAKHLLPQFLKPRIFNYNFAASGGKLITYGLFKKIVIADKIAPLVDIVYNNPSAHSGLILFLATFLFAVQIYCDFSGYTDIAIGTARILGFDLLKNFDFPYFSKSFKEFWSRWHISLSSWFRDYVYIPLGGSRLTKLKTHRNTLITFILSGLWHGANWTFVLWGGLHGAYLIVERKLKLRLPALIQIVITFTLTLLAWVFFRSNTIQDALYILKSMLKLSVSDLSMQFRGLGIQLTDLITIVGLLGFFVITEWLLFKDILPRWFSRFKKLQWAFYYLLIILIAFWGFENSAKNFIYFQF